MKRIVATKNNTRNQIKYLPCLRCAQFTVTALILQPFEKLELRDLLCQQCNTPHFLVATFSDGGWRVTYERDTRRYPAEYYDENPFVIVKLEGIRSTCSENDEPDFAGHGPILVYQRKRFSSPEVRMIWRRSNRKCHLCGKRWNLDQRSRNGWHIDHLIPNIGGGRNTEQMDNFRVACAFCNLSKGRGHTTRSVHEALRSIFQ